MKEYPISMTGSMVQAVLAGKKTQTRRPLKLPKWSTQKWSDFEINCQDEPEIVCKKTGCTANIKSPYGYSGDLLWVRETWAKSDEGTLAYRASKTPLWVSKWKPSIFMPREACRIILEVVSVRVERLQEISEVDAIAEGVDHTNCASPIDAYWSLWENINGKGSWDLNPWVWVIEFNLAKS